MERSGFARNVNFVLLVNTEILDYLLLQGIVHAKCHFS